MSNVVYSDAEREVDELVYACRNLRDEVEQNEESIANFFANTDNMRNYDFAREFYELYKLCSRLSKISSEEMRW